MNDEENEKIISWRKFENNDKSVNNKKNLILKEYSNKEREYINKYLNISKNVLNEEKIYDIIIKFNFNEQLILAEIFQLLDEVNERDKEKNKIINKSIFVPYKTKYGIEKSIYSLKAENKPKIKTLSKEKKIYKYENNNISKLNDKKNVNISNEENNKEENFDKTQLYPKRFSNFNQIIKDFRYKKNKDENNNNNFYKKINKINYKNKTLGGKINNNKNYIVPFKYYNSKKFQNEENKEIINNNQNEMAPKIKQDIFVKENIINFEYKTPDFKTKNKSDEFSVSIRDEIEIEGIINSPPEKEENNKNINDNNANQELNNININTNSNGLKTHNNNNLKIIEKNTVITNYINKKNENNQNLINNINNNNIYKYNYPKMNMNSTYFNNYNSSICLESYKNNFYQKSINCSVINSNYNNINNNIFIKNYNYNNNFFLNQKIGVPLYFYPYYFKSNNIMMSKYINMQAINNNNFLFNSIYNPQMVRIYYQGINNNKKLNYFNNKNIMTQTNPMMYYLLMRKICMNFNTNQNIKKATR